MGHAQQVVPIPPAPVQQPPLPPAAAPPTTTPSQPVVPAPVIPIVPVNPRAFTTPTGLIFTSVRPERVIDFETVMTYLQEALRTTTDAGLRRQAEGWRIFKDTQVGPNASVVYVYVIDPVVPGATYDLGPILSAAYPDRIQEIWKLYTGAIIQQSVVNAAPFVPLVLPPAAAPAPAPAGRGAQPAGRGGAQ